jgi:hypothetical protein
MGYWTEVFALDTVAMASIIHVGIYGFHTAEVLMYLLLTGKRNIHTYIEESN